MLVGGEIVAAIDLKTNRANKKLLMQKWSWVGQAARGARKDLKRRIEEELDKFESSQHFASQELIIVWLEVRVLPAPPRSLTQTEISRFIANSPELAGIRRRILSLQAGDWVSVAVSAPLSLPAKSRFPAAETSVGETRFECSGSVRRKAEHLVLPRPLGR